jgi:hypothetical protein
MAKQPPVVSPETLAAHLEFVRDNDAALRDADVHLAGGDAITDEIEAAADYAEAKSGQVAEWRDREIAELRAKFEEQQAMIERLMAQGVGADGIGKLETAAQRRAQDDQMIRNLVARGGREVVMIHPAGNPNENWPVPVGINGVVLTLPRGRRVEVPVEFIAVLHQARWPATPQPLLDGNEDGITVLQSMAGQGTVEDHASYQYSILPGSKPELQLGKDWRPLDESLARGANQRRIKPGENPIQALQQEA